MLEECKYWYEKGYKSFIFNDSLFSLDKKRIIEFCDSVIESKLNINFVVDGARADHLADYKLLKKMRRANFTHITLGVESASNKILKNLKKGEDIETIEKTLFFADKLGFTIGLFFLIGSPGETLEDINQSFKFALKYRNVSTVYFFKLTPLLGTEYYEYAKSKGYIHEKEALYPDYNFGLEKNVTYGTETLPVKEFNYALKKARKIEKFIRLRYKIKTEIYKKFNIDIKT